MSYASDSHIAVLDGTELDLSRDLVDVTGVVWAWTGKRDRRGQPLMRSRLDADTETTFPSVRRALPLDLVYADHGPLIPAAAPTPPAIRRAAWTAPSPRHLAHLLDSLKGGTHA